MKNWRQNLGALETIYTEQKESQESTEPGQTARVQCQVSARLKIQQPLTGLSIWSKTGEKMCKQSDREALVLCVSALVGYRSKGGFTAGNTQDPDGACRAVSAAMRLLRSSRVKMQEMEGMKIILLTLTLLHFQLPFKPLEGLDGQRETSR